MAGRPQISKRINEIIVSGSKQILWRKIKTALVVLLITFLIWYVADLNVAEDGTFQITIRLTSADPNRYAALAAPPYQRTIEVKLRGRRRRLRNFRALVEDTEVFDVEIDRSKSSGNEPLELSTIDDVLTKVTDLQESRLTIVEAVPRLLVARIDEMVTKKVPIRENYGNLDVVAKLSHQAVSVRMPEFAWEKLGDDPVVLDNAVLDGVAKEGGDGFEEDVPLKLRLLDEIGLDPATVKFQPSKVTITGRIKAKRVTKSKGPVQIKWYVPQEVQKDYVIITDEKKLRTSIDVNGPETRIDQLNAADIRAWVEVFAGDVDDPGPGKEIKRKVEFNFPPGFSDCTPILEPPPEIVFELEPKTGNTTASGQG